MGACALSNSGYRILSARLTINKNEMGRILSNYILVHVRHAHASCVWVRWIIPWGCSLSDARAWQRMALPFVDSRIGMSVSGFVGSL